jgi:radical SAM protein with 4Fe4S-binding SPASM domain
LRFDFVEKTLDQLKAFDVKSVVYKGGGEPTLHPHLVDMIDLAGYKGFKIAMLTNGSTLEDNIKLQTAILTHMEYVRISLDAATAEEHKRWHGTDDWESIIAGIRQLVMLKHSVKSKTLIGVNILYDVQSWRKMPEAINRAKELGIDILSYRKAYSTAYGFENKWTENEEYNCDVLIELLKEKKKPDNLHIMWDASRGESINEHAEDVLPYCLAVPLIAVICADRNVYPCCDLRMVDQYSLGNLDMNTFEEIWDSDRRKVVMQDVKFKKCYSMCTHRFSYYNSMLNYLVDEDKPHVEII